jgi:molybdenum cofactor cytidylyltransferase
LIAAYKQRPDEASVVVPQVQGKRGNPVIFSHDVRQLILQDALNVGCRQWQDQHPSAVHRYLTDNRRYRVDLDTPEDMAQFTKDTGHQLRWPETASAALG